MARHKYRDFPDADVKRYLNTTIIRVRDVLLFKAFGHFKYMIIMDY